MSPKSKTPYLLRALFDWMVDSGYTPYLLILVDEPSVKVPQQYVNEGKIVLNISPNAVRDLEIGEQFVAFDGRFAGTPFWVEVPISKVQAIYAKETGDGMMFEVEPGAEASLAEDDPQDGVAAPSPKRPGGLKVVK